MLLIILKLRFLLHILFILLFFMSCEDPAVIVDVLMSLKYQVVTIAMIIMNQFVAAIELPMATNVMLKTQVSQNG